MLENMEQLASNEQKELAHAIKRMYAFLKKYTHYPRDPVSGGPDTSITPGDIGEISLEGRDILGKLVLSIQKNGVRIPYYGKTDYSETNKVDHSKIIDKVTLQDNNLCNDDLCGFCGKKFTVDLGLTFFMANHANPVCDEFGKKYSPEL